MSTEQQATLDAWTPAEAAADPEPATSDGRDERPASTPHGDGSLASVFEAVTGETTIVDAQREAPSHAPIEDSEHDHDPTPSGLTDAVAGTEDHQ